MNKLKSELIPCQICRNAPVSCFADDGSNYLLACDSCLELNPIELSAEQKKIAAALRAAQEEEDFFFAGEGETNILEIGGSDPHPFHLRIQNLNPRT